MLSPRWTTEPSRVSRWLKKARSNSSLPAYWIAEASRSTSGRLAPESAPAPAFLSQPRPIISLPRGVPSSRARAISPPRMSSITSANLPVGRSATEGSDGPDGLDGVGLVDGLVVAVAEDPREPEGQTAGVAAGALETV